jgi:PPP family 3-phenylpropionic acid transporter
MAGKYATHPRDRLCGTPAAVSGPVPWALVRGIQGLYFADGAAIGVIFPFIGVILAGRGLDPAAIGTVSALTAVAFTVALPLWGHLGDVVLGRGRALELAVVGSALAAIVFNGPVPIVVAAIALVALTLFEAPWLAFTDAMAVNALRGRARDYTRARVIASGSFAAASILSGFLYDRTGYAPASLLFVVCAVVLGVTVLFVPDVPRARLETYRTWVPLTPTSAGQGDEGAAPPGRRREGLGSIGTVLRVAPRLRGVVAAIVLLNVAVIASFTFLPLRLVDLGASPSVVALSVGLGAVAEIPGMIVAGRVAARVGLRAVFAFGCTVYAFAFLVWMSVDVPALIVASRFVSGVGYASFTVAMVLSVSSILPERLQASGQALMQTAAQGLGAIVANLAGGQLIDRAGYPALFGVAAVMALAAAVVGWRFLPRRGEPIASRPEPQTDDAAAEVQLAYTLR